MQTPFYATDCKTVNVGFGGKGELYGKRLRNPDGDQLDSQAMGVFYRGLASFQAVLRAVKMWHEPGEPGSSQAKH